MDERYDSKTTFRFKMIVRVMNAAGLVHATLLFLVVYLCASFYIWLNEPMMNNLGDAMWFLYQVVATIGLGDFTCTTVVGRVLTVIVSLLSIFLIAVLTGAVVSYCSEVMRARHEESAAKFLVKLENLDKLSHEELAELSAAAVRFRKRHGIKEPADAEDGAAAS